MTPDLLAAPRTRLQHLSSTRLPRVDVVIPCYNYGHYLAGCIDSVLSQPGVEARVLVIDDASTDGSAAVGAQIAEADRRVEFRPHALNRGHIATYNEGLLGWADSDYVVLLSADDLLVPGSLERAARAMKANPSVGMVYGRSVYFESDAALPRITSRQRGLTVWSGREWIEGRCRSGHNVISSPEVVVRCDVQQRVGGYRPELPHAGDLEMWLRIAAVADIAYVRGVPQAYYRIQPSSMMRSTFSAPCADLRQRGAAFDSFFEQHADIPAGERLRDMAHQAIARDALWKACRAYDRDRLDVVPADEFVDFALSSYPPAVDLGEYRALRRRQALGPRVCSRTQLFLLPHVVKRAREWMRWQRWKRRGV
jgi:hypothetical protein